MKVLGQRSNGAGSTPPNTSRGDQGRSPPPRPRFRRAARDRVGCATARRLQITRMGAIRITPTMSPIHQVSQIGPNRSHSARPPSRRGWRRRASRSRSARPGRRRRRIAAPCSRSRTRASPRANRVTSQPPASASACCRRRCRGRRAPSRRSSSVDQERADEDRRPHPSAIEDDRRQGDAARRPDRGRALMQRRELQADFAGDEVDERRDRRGGAIHAIDGRSCAREPVGGAAPARSVAVASRVAAERTPTRPPSRRAYSDSTSRPGGERSRPSGNPRLQQRCETRGLLARRMLGVDLDLDRAGACGLRCARRTRRRARRRGRSRAGTSPARPGASTRCVHANRLAGPDRFRQIGATAVHHRDAAVRRRASDRRDGCGPSRWRARDGRWRW